MRGRQVFMESLRLHGVDKIFGNPGTTENPLLESLAEYPMIEYIVALHEAVAVCAAGHYAVASGKTGVANLHVAPGLGNAIGMMYGAKRADAPVIVTAGQQDVRMRLRDPILRDDLVAMAAPVSKWAVEAQSADELGPIMQRAFRVANEAPCGPVFVGLPNNVMSDTTTVAATTAGDIADSRLPAPSAIDQLAKLLVHADNPVIFAGDGIATAGANDVFTDICELIGASVYTELLRARQVIAARHPSLCGRIPITQGEIHKLLSHHDVLLTIGVPFVEEIWFDAESPIPASTRVAQIDNTPSRVGHQYSVDIGIVGDIRLSIERLVDQIQQTQNDAEKTRAVSRNNELQTAKQRTLEYRDKLIADKRSRSPMTANVALKVLADALPDDAIVVNEAVSSATDLEHAFAPAGSTDFYMGRGGGIGQGLAGGPGVALAHPDRMTVVVSGDGSAMYSIQALWTAAHHQLNVTFVILANREYRVLKHNLDTHRRRFEDQPERPYPHMDLSDPTLGFVAMAAGMGVAGGTAITPDDIPALAQAAIETSGPYLIELVVAGKDAE